MLAFYAFFAWFGLRDVLRACSAEGGRVRGGRGVGLRRLLGGRGQASVRAGGRARGAEKASAPARGRPAHTAAWNTSRQTSYHSRLSAWLWHANIVATSSSRRSPTRRN